MPTLITPRLGAALLALFAAAAAWASEADAASRLLWTDFTTNSIGRAELNGSNAVAGFIGGASSPSSVVVRGRYIYWANGTGGSIGRASTDGTGVNQTFVSGITGSPFGVAVNATHIYWTVPFTNRIGRAGIDGSGLSQTFLTGPSGLSFPTGIAVDATHMYWSNSTANSIGRANLDGTGAVGNFINTGAPIDGSFALVVTDEHIYWANDDTDTISRANLDGSQVDLSFVPSAGAAMRGLAVGAGGIYWSDNAAGNIARADADGGGASVVLSPLPDPGGVALALDAASFNPGAIDFGGMPVDAGLSPATDLTLRNTGNTTLDMGVVDIGGAQASSFAVVNDGCGGRPLEVAAACTVRVAFQPTAEGPASATLSLGGAALDAPATVGLSGTGIADLTPSLAPAPAPVPAPPSEPVPVSPRLGRLAIAPTAAQQRGAPGRAVATVRVPSRGRLTGGGRVEAGGRSLPVAVTPVVARAAGPLRFALRLPTAVRAEIARRGRVTARLRLDLSRDGSFVAAGSRTVRIAAPPSRVFPRQWLGKRLGPWRTPPPLSARERGALRIEGRAGAWRATIVR